MTERTVPILSGRDLADAGPLGAARVRERGHAAGDLRLLPPAPALHGEWAGLVAPDPATGSRVRPLQNTDDGIREFAVVGRSGNLVRVGSFVS